MNLAEEIYQKSLALPETQAREVIDFIDFLRTRSQELTGTPEEDERAKARREALAYLATVRIDFGGKPMTDREEANAR